MAGTASVGGKMSSDVDQNLLNSGIDAVDSKPISRRTISPGLSLDHQSPRNHIKDGVTLPSTGVDIKDNQLVNSRIGNSHTNRTDACITLGPGVLSNPPMSTPHTLYDNFNNSPVIGNQNVQNSNNSHNISSANMTGQNKISRTQLESDGNARSSPVMVKQEPLNVGNSQLQQPNTTSIVTTMAASGNVKMATVNVTSASAITAPGHISSPMVMTPPAGALGNVRTIAPQLLSQQIRIAGQQMIAPTRGPVVRLPPGTTLPPGFVLINKDGNIQAVQINTLQPHLTSNAGIQGNIAIRPMQGNPLVSPIQRTLIPQPASQSVVSTIALTSAPILTNAKPITSVVSAISGSKTSTVTSSPSALGGAAVNKNAMTTANKRALDDVNKCKNFLNTLIRLASNGNQPPQTVQNVKDLVKNLIDGVIQPDEFTRKLQKELKSSPQPYLVPFLKKNLPPLRQLIQRGGISPIHGITPNIQATAPGSTTSSIASVLTAPKGAIASQIKAGMKHIKQEKSGKSSSDQHKSHSSSKHHHGTSSTPSVVPGVGGHSIKTEVSSSHAETTTSSSRSGKSHSKSSKSSRSSSSSPRRDRSKDSSFVRDDDDINDVTSMAGVNLSEESARMASNAEHIGTQLRSCEEEAFLSSSSLQSRIQLKCAQHNLKDTSRETIELISAAVEEKLKSMVEKLSVIAQHRLEIYRDDPKYETISDVRSQLKFFEQLDAMERKRRDEQEREMLLRAAKSRSKQEDPEQLRLKRKAKEMQQMEAEQIRQQEANLTALAAIGPRKKKKTDSPPTSSQENVSSLIGAGGSSSSHYRTQLRRIKRVNIRDLIFLMEQEGESRKSHLLFHTYFK
ncbi:Transcription initiation factor TFIID subunit 4 [Holothuria leucospilota]|uniref:Transcription initiation factor TFIID subunit 4 n=1 Tax=Holothuria leucospilota TaxID=206669 RepID=A0A9Q1CBN9_HOLLE|nr:Transcription initiation factor TFIID subunit 4 [Holothuria leucospilota]